MSHRKDRPAAVHSGAGGRERRNRLTGSTTFPRAATGNTTKRKSPTEAPHSIGLLPESAERGRPAGNTTFRRAEPEQKKKPRRKHHLPTGRLPETGNTAYTRTYMQPTRKGKEI
ncbi:MAG: hypothetical protein K2I22_03050 [Lachnospiraceae bacterium]|nr:hypothetical protein [Lachnospiraceae bacterium]